MYCIKCKRKMQKLDKYWICNICPHIEFFSTSERWNRISNNSEYWHHDAFEKYPAIIASQYHELYELIKNSNTFGILLQLKNVMEILLKFPLIIIASNISIKKDIQETERELLTKYAKFDISFNDWLDIAHYIIKNQIKIPNSLEYILKNILEILENNKIAVWINNIMYTCASKIDENTELQLKANELVMLITEHFKTNDSFYQKILFYTQNDSERELLLGYESFNKNKQLDGHLFVDVDNIEIPLHPFICILEGNIYVFKSFSIINPDNSIIAINYSNMDITKISDNSISEFTKKHLTFSVPEDNKYTDLKKEQLIETYYTSILEDIISKQFLTENNFTNCKENLPNIINSEEIQKLFITLKQLYGNKYFNQIINLILAIYSAFEPLRINEISYMLNGDFSIVPEYFSYINDIKSFIGITKNNKFVIFSSKNNSIAEYVRNEFKENYIDLIVKIVKNMLSIGSAISTNAELYCMAYLFDYGKTVFSKKGLIKFSKDFYEIFLNSAYTFHNIYNNKSTILEHYTCSRLLKLLDNTIDAIRVLDDNNIDCNYELLVKCYLIKGKLLFLCNKLQKSLEYYQKAIEISDSILIKGKVFDINLLAECYINIAKIEEIIEHNNEKQNKNEYYDKIIHNYTKAITIMERLRKENRLANYITFVEALRKRGNLYRRAKNLIKAMLDFDHAVKILENQSLNDIKIKDILSDLYFDKAVMFCRISENDKAIQCFDNSIILREDLIENESTENTGKLKNKLAEAFIERSYAYKITGEYKKAFEDVNKSIEIIENLINSKQIFSENLLAKAYMLLGRILIDVGEIEKAVDECLKSIKICQKLISENKCLNEEVYSSSLINLGICLKECGDLNQALIELNKGISIKERLFIEESLVYEQELLFAYFVRDNIYNNTSELKKSIDELNIEIKVVEKLRTDGLLADENLLASLYINRASYFIESKLYDLAFEDLKKAYSITENLMKKRPELIGQFFKIMYGIILLEKCDDNMYESLIYSVENFKLTEEAKYWLKELSLHLESK